MIDIKINFGDCVFMIECSATLNGYIDCGSGPVNMGLGEDNCTFSCDPGYMLQGSATSGTCENTGSWSGGLPSCVPLNCSADNLPIPANATVLQLPSCVPLNCGEDNLPIPANATVLQLPSCDLAYQSQCTVSCDEGFTGDDVTYLCNVTSDPTMVDWMAINSTATHMCQGGSYS